MTASSDKRLCRDRFLLIFGEKACTRKRLYESQEGENHLFLAKDELMLGEDEVISVQQRGGEYFLGKERIREDQPFYYLTMQKEKLMLILTRCLSETEWAERLLLPRQESCQIGNAYKNRIFYECFGLVGGRHAAICFEDGSFVVSAEKENEGIYVNGRALEGKRNLSKGDQIDIYGLHLLLCGDLLLCVSFAGTIRVAGKARD